MRVNVTLYKKLTAFFVAVAMMVAVPLAVSAGTTTESLCTGSGGTIANGKCVNNPDSINSQPTVMTTIRNITNLLVFVLGAVAVIMIIVGGVRYVTSGGDQNAITGAKNTVMYAIIGVVVAIAAYAIVNFVTTWMK